MLTALELLERIATAPEPERGVCRKCDRPAAANLLWLCEGCADKLHTDAPDVERQSPSAETEARMRARVMEIGERFGYPDDLFLDAGKANWERKAAAFPERALEAAETLAAKLDQDDKEDLPF